MPQRTAQGPSRTCNESKGEEEAAEDAARPADGQSLASLDAPPRGAAYL